MLSFLIVAAIVIAVIIGYKTGFNTGFFAIIFAYLIGCFAMGMQPKQVIAGWPVNTMFVIFFRISVLQFRTCKRNSGKNFPLSSLCMS